MAEIRLDIGVIVTRRRIEGPWAQEVWIPCSVLPAAPEAPAWTPLGAGEAQLFYAGPAVLTFHSAATAYYRANLENERSLWVALECTDRDRCRISRVTADPFEGEALTEGLGAVVEPVAMPNPLGDQLACFCETFHVERPFMKRQRDRADPQALSRRPRLHRHGARYSG